MEQIEYSTIHIKAPHTTHIGAKVLAAKNGRSMNQLIIDLIDAAMKADGMDRDFVEAGIQAYRKSTPKQRKVLEKIGEEELLTQDDWTVLDIDTLLPQEKKEQHPSVEKQLQERGLAYDKYNPDRAVDPKTGETYPYMVEDGLVVLL